MERKLAAILAADLVGYSRLMGEDEAGTLTALKALRAEFIDPTITEHRGRIVKLMGDGVLVEFPSVVDALQCAVAVQRGMMAQNAGLPENRRIAFRIGVNLGDIIVDGDDIYGNGVNVAARLEALAEPNGICISGRVLDQVEKNVDVGFAYLGPQAVKNIEKPVNAYKILLDPSDAGKIVGAPKAKVSARPWLIAALLVLVVAGGGAGLWYYQIRPDFEPAAVGKMTYPLPDEPSIAVLPFDNYSGDAEDGLIAKGLTEDIIAALSNVPEVFVISRTSTFAYAGKPVTVKQVAEDLGVRYVMEGSVQRSGDRLRVTAQLIDAVTGRHVWADRYDRRVEDLFALQDELVLRILIELRVKLTRGESGRSTGRGTTHLKAWLLAIQAAEEGFKFTRESLVKARDLYERAHELDPNWGIPLGGIAWMYWWEARQGWTDNPEESIQKGIEFAERAIALDPGERLGYHQLGNLKALQGDYDQAVALREKAVELAPNDFLANWGLAGVLNKAGDPERALDVLQHAERLSPRFPASFLWTLQEAQFLAGAYEATVETAKRGIARQPNRAFSHIFLTAAYSALGRSEDARAEAHEVLRIDPKFTVSAWMPTRVYKDPQASETRARFLVNAGLPE